MRWEDFTPSPAAPVPTTENAPMLTVSASNCATVAQIRTGRRWWQFGNWCNISRKSVQTLRRQMGKPAHLASGKWESVPDADGGEE